MNTVAEPCPVCRRVAQVAGQLLGDADRVICKDCGEYMIVDTAKETGSYLSPEERRKQLERAKQQARPGELPLIEGYDAV